MYVMCNEVQSETIIDTEKEELILVVNGNVREDCRVDYEVIKLIKKLEGILGRGESVTILLASDDLNDRCERVLERLQLVEREKEKKKKRRSDFMTIKFATVPRDEGLIGGPRSRAMSVRVMKWIRERRLNNERRGETYAFVDCADVLMYFAVIAKETREITESLFDNVSFARINLVESDGNNDESSSSSSSSSSSDDFSNSAAELYDALEARWMSMESRKRAELIEIDSFETRLSEIRAKRKSALDENKMAMEIERSFADDSTVGVVMTHKNRPEFCEKAIDALLQQTHRKLEIIIVDDGSEEENVIRLETFVNTRVRVVVNSNKIVKIVKIEKPGKFLGKARNVGVDALSENILYVLFSDDDNLAEANEIETMIRVFVHTKADVVTASNEFFVSAANGTNVVVGSYHPLGNALFPGVFENVFGDANALWKKSAFKSLGGFAEDHSYSLQDWQIMNQASSNGYKIVTVPSPALYKYRTHSNSMTKEKEMSRKVRNLYEDVQFTGPLRGLAPLGDELVEFATFAKKLRKEYSLLEKKLFSVNAAEGGVAIGKAALRVLCKKLSDDFETEYIKNGAFDEVDEQHWNKHGEGGFSKINGAIRVPGDEEMMLDDSASTLVGGAWQRIEVNQREAEPLILSGWAKVIYDGESDIVNERIFETSIDFSLHADIEFIDGSKRYGVSANFRESGELHRSLVIIDEEKQIASITIVCMRRWRARAALFDDISLKPLANRKVACDLARNEREAEAEDAVVSSKKYRGNEEL